MVLSSPSDPLPIPDPDGLQGQNETGIIFDPSISILASGLDRPRAIAVHDDRVFITEQRGTVRVVENGILLERPLAVFRGVDEYDAGLLGIAVHPDFDDNHYLYVFLSYQNDTTHDATPGAPHAQASMIYNKIVRITESGNRLVDTVDILDGIPASKFTNGGFLKFGPDGMLYAGTGTTSDASHLPHDVQSLAGKILRITDAGDIPGDNPFDSAVYSTGHRNPQGMAWDLTGAMYAAERGPEKNDEINLIVPGAGYGWPGSECHSGNDTATGPLVTCYDPSIGPGGIAHHGNYNRLGLEHPFVMASLDASNLYELDFEQGLSSQKPVLSGVGRIRDVVVHPDDGTIYVITSNTDGKGFAGPDDDRLIRIIR